MIAWIEPKYSPIKIDNLERMILHDSQAAIDRYAPLDVRLSIGSFNEQRPTSGILTFYKSISFFLRKIEEPKIPNLIIDDDDAFHIRYERQGDKYKVVLRCAMRTLGKEILLKEEIERAASAYREDFMQFIERIGLAKEFDARLDN